MSMQWWREGTPQGKKALIAASLGWMLDSFDVMLYALVLPDLMTALSLDRATSGSIQSLMLLSAAAGGLFFGVMSDRFGRTRALVWSVLLYSIFTAACGFATSALQLAVFRVLLGLGMGGEWASGATLVSLTTSTPAPPAWFLSSVPSPYPYGSPSLTTIVRRQPSACIAWSSARAWTGSGGISRM